MTHNKKNCRKCGNRVNAPFMKNGVAWIVPMGSPHGKPRPVVGAKVPVEPEPEVVEVEVVEEVVNEHEVIEVYWSGPEPEDTE